MVMRNVVVIVHVVELDLIVHIIVNLETDVVVSRTKKYKDKVIKP